MEALLLCCSSIQINHLYHLRGGFFHKERSNGWVFLNTISRTTLLGFFHVLISWYMKGWNPQMVSCVLCWWFSYNSSSTMQSVWAKQGQEYYGHPFCTVFYRCLSCCQKFNGFFWGFFFSCCGRWYHSLHRSSYGDWAFLGPKKQSVCRYTRLQSRSINFGLNPTLQLAGPVTSATHVAAMSTGWTLSF